jgi:hypothetical protein
LRDTAGSIHKQAGAPANLRPEQQHAPWESPGDDGVRG